VVKEVEEEKILLKQVGKIRTKLTRLLKNLRL